MSDEEEPSNEKSRWWSPGSQVIPLPVTIVLLIGICFGFYIYAWPWLYWSVPFLHPDDLPGVNDHWHADYVINICDEPHPPLPYSLGDVHTHGDGQIHLHPSSPETAGKNANLEAFFHNAGGTITQSRIVIPPMLDMRNGETCPDGREGELSVYRNGEPVENFPSLVPRQGDTVTIHFGPEKQPGERPIPESSSSGSN